MDRPQETFRPDDAPASAAKDPDPSAVRGGEEIRNASVVGRTVTIAKPRVEVYGFWRELRNLARFMENIESIEVQAADTSRWIVKAPGGKTVAWTSRIVRDEPNRLIAWESINGSDVAHKGEVTFSDAPGQRGTQVTATIVYHPPGGKVGKLIAKAFHREPNIQTRRDLRRLKQLLETGEVATAEPGAAAPRT
jgi:uncharacterized membrane protein